MLFTVFVNSKNPNLGEFEEPRPQIIGGQDADIADYPWMGALVRNVEGDNTQQFCGCTAIDPYWVVTAAHCLDRDIGIEEFKVVFETSLLQSTNAAEGHYPKAVIFHPNYASIYDFEHDIALIQLSRPLPARIPIVPLVSSDSLETPGIVAKALGWGLTSFDFSDFQDTNKLQQVDLPIVSREFANDALYFNGRITENILIGICFLAAKPPRY
jgi:secreted trypsin-like serine protease